MRRLVLALLTVLTAVTLAGAPARADQAVDYSGARPSPADIRAHGYVGVIRYIGAPGDWRAMNAAELASYRAANLKVAVVYEHGAGNFWTGGYNSGLVVGRAARQYADALGWHGPVYIATDVDVPPSGVGTAVDAYRGARDGLGDLPLGAYGGKLLLRAVRDQLGVQYLWSSNATYWDHGVGLPVDIQQHYSPNPPIPNTDVNDVYGSWGYWPADPDAVVLASPDQVRALLESWNYPCVDYGHASTFWCVAAFQQAFGLPVDGVWGVNTQAAAQAWLTYLLSIPKPQTPEQAALAFIVSCTQQSFVWGDSGPCVNLAQGLLLRAGYVVEQNGVYGFETAGAVAQFQHDNDIPVTAGVDPGTWASLSKDPAF